MPLTHFRNGITSLGSPVLTVADVPDSLRVTPPPAFKGTKLTTDQDDIVLTVDQFVGAVEVLLGTETDGATNMTTPSAAEIIEAMSSLAISGIYRIRIDNVNPGTVTLIGGAGVTIIGEEQIAANKWREYLVVYHDTDEVHVQNCGSGGE